MTQDDIRAWARSGALNGDQAAAFWTWFYCQREKTLPRIKELMAGVERDYGVAISEATASRGRELALTMILLRFFAPGGTFPDLPPFSENVC